MLFVLLHKTYHFEYIMLKNFEFNALRWEVVVCSVDIGGIVDHHVYLWILLIKTTNITINDIHVDCQFNRDIT
jgi:hypothetical protein